MELAKQSCKPCEGGVQPLNSTTSNKLLEKIPSWQISEGKLKKEFSFDDFKQALAFVNTVGEIAEHENHHPNICFTWGEVNITLYTHAINGLSNNDFILAAKIDQSQ